MAFVCIAQTAATVRSASPGAPATDDFNQDLVGVGAGSVAAGLIGSFAVDASPPNTTIVAASGARSQLTNIMAAVVVLIVVLVATHPLAHLPQATLGATLLYVATRLFRVRELHNILRFDRTEFALAVATLLAVALVGIEQGVILAIVLSLADRTRRTARPSDTLLGREPGTDHWIPTDLGKPTEQVPGVLVYQVYAPLWYGNADYLRLRIRNLVDSAPPRYMPWSSTPPAYLTSTTPGCRRFVTCVTELADAGSPSASPDRHTWSTTTSNTGRSSNSSAPTASTTRSKRPSSPPSTRPDPVSAISSGLPAGGRRLQCADRHRDEIVHDLGSERLAVDHEPVKDRTEYQVDGNLGVDQCGSRGGQRPARSCRRRVDSSARRDGPGRGRPVPGS